MAAAWGKTQARKTVHFLRTEYDRLIHERPQAAYRQRAAERASLPNFLEYAEKLVNDGCVVVPDFFESEKLTQIRDEFERLMRSNPPDPEAESKNSAHIATSRTAESVLFSELAFEPNLIALVEYYWGKPVVLKGTGGTRIDPIDTEDYRSYQWHHDGKRKAIRAFIYLWDVPADGQVTKFVPGTHKIFYRDISDSRLTEDEVRRYGEPIACAGLAGAVALIDTNGCHRGTRNLGPRRDTWNYSYRAPGAASAPLGPVVPLHPDVVKRLTPEQRRIARLD